MSRRQSGISCSTLCSGLLYGQLSRFGGEVAFLLPAATAAAPLTLQVATNGEPSINLALPAQGSARAQSAQPDAAAIIVSEATYGGNCKAPRNNALEALAKACNGRGDCEYVVDHNLLGDPAFGCPKDFAARWRCSDHGEQRSIVVPAEAGSGSKLKLSCQSLSVHEETKPNTQLQVAGAAPSLRLETSSPQVGQPIVVLFDNLPGTPKNWISIAAEGSSDEKYLQYSYTGDTASGRLKFDPQLPGNYELRVYYNDSFKVETRLTFTVEGEPSQASGQMPKPSPLTEPDNAAVSGLVNVANRELGAFAQAAEGWEFMLDGNSAGYDETKGTTTLSPDWPNRIWLARPYAIDRIRFLLCSLDQRTYRYKLEGSPDGVSWSVISESASATGWLDIPLGGSSFIAFRFSDFGTDAADGKFCLVEFAAFASKTPPLPALALPSDDSEPPWQDRPAERPLNVALAALGAKAEGGSSPNNIIDGDFSEASRSEIPLGEHLTLTLDRAYELASLRITLPVTGDRTYRYRLEGTPDGDKWELLADRTQSDQSGVQDIDLAGRSLKAIRIVGTAAPSSEAFAVIEVETLASSAVPITGTAAVLNVQNETSEGNLALALHGGRVEKVSSRLDALRDELHLIDGLPFNGAAWVAADASLPQDMVLSFAGHSTALIDGIDLYLPDGVTAPALVDVAIASGEASAGWQRVGRYALSPPPGWSTSCDKVCYGAQRITFSPVLARALRLTVIKMWGDGPVGIGEIVAREGKREGYASLLPYRRSDFTGGINIANVALGGSIESAIPPAEYAEAPPELLIDGFSDGGGYWAPGNDATTPQIVLSFYGKRSALIGGVAFSPNGGHSNFTAPGNVRWTSLVDVWTSDVSSTTGYRWAGRFRIDQAERTQVFAFEPVRAKYVRVLLLATQRPIPYGMVLGEIEVLEARAPEYTSILADRPPSLLDFRFGGHLAVPFGTRRSDLIDSTVATPGWFADSNDLPITLTFGFYHGQKRRIGAIGFNPRTERDPGSWVRRVKVLISDHPLRGFKAVGEFELVQQDELQYFDIGPAEARYVQLRLLETAGTGKGVSLGEVAVREAGTLGGLSAIARRVDPLPEESAAADSATAGWKAELSEAESNNAPETANPLPLARDLAGRISPLSDIDWYAIDTTAGPTDSLNLSLEEHPVLRMGLELFDSAGTLIASKPLHDLGRERARPTWSIPRGHYLAKLSRPQNSIRYSFIVDQERFGHSRAGRNCSDGR